MVGTLIVLFLVCAIAFVGALLMMRASRREIDERIKLVAAHEAIEIGASQQRPKPSILAVSDSYARRILGFGIKYRWGMKSGASSLAIVGVTGFAFVFVLLGILLQFGLWIALAAATAMFWFLPHMILRREQRKAEMQFIELFADAVDMVVRMLRAGLPVTAAIRATGTDGPPPVNEVFLSLSDQVEIGIPFDEALVSIAEQVGVADFRFFAAAVTLQRSTGGNLAATLETLSDIIRKRRAGRMKARAVTAEVRATAYVLAALPFVVLIGLLILNPRYLAPLIDDPRGNIILGSAAGLLITAFVTMRQMMRSVTKI